MSWVCLRGAQPELQEICYEKGKLLLANFDGSARKIKRVHLLSFSFTDGNFGRQWEMSKTENNTSRLHSQLKEGTLSSCEVPVITRQ